MQQHARSAPMFSAIRYRIMTEKTEKIVRAVCFGIGIVIGLSMMWFVFRQTGAIAGAVGGLLGAMLGLGLFGAVAKFMK